MAYYPPLHCDYCDIGLLYHIEGTSISECSNCGRHYPIVPRSNFNQDP